jgi:addiction module HigA family antidote
VGEVGACYSRHAGELLLSEFMEPLDLDAASVAAAISVGRARLEALIDGSVRVDAELYLWLSRDFRMSEGLFLRLQDQHELRHARFALGSDLNQIAPHIA